MKRTTHSAEQIVTKLREAKALAANWRDEQNHHRPHSSLGYKPPAAFAATLAVPEGGAQPRLEARPACSTTLTRLSQHLVQKMGAAHQSPRRLRAENQMGSPGYNRPDAGSVIEQSVSDGPRGIEHVRRSTMCQSRVRIIGRMSLCALLMAACASCSSVTVMKVPTPTQYLEDGRSTWSRADQVKADSMEGIRFYLPRPFVSVFESFPIATDLYLASGRISPDGKYIVIEEVKDVSTGQLLTDGQSAVKIGLKEVPQRMAFRKAPEGADTGTDANAQSGADELGDSPTVEQLKAAVAAAAAKLAAAEKAAGDAAQAANNANRAAGSTTGSPPPQTGTSQRQVTNNNGAFAFQPLRGNFDLVYLPDFDEQYVVSSRSGLGSARFGVNLGQGWSLQGFDSFTDNSELNKRIFALIDTGVQAAQKAAVAGLGALFPPAGAAAALGMATPQSGFESDEQAGTLVTLKIVVVHYAAKGLYPVIKPRELQDRAAPGLILNLADDSGRFIELTDDQIRKAAEQFDRHQRRFTAPVYPYQYVSFNTFRYMAIEVLTTDGAPFGTLYDKTGTAGELGDRRSALSASGGVNEPEPPTDPCAGVLTGLQAPLKEAVDASLGEEKRLLVPPVTVERVGKSDGIKSLKISVLLDTDQAGVDARESAIAKAVNEKLTELLRNEDVAKKVRGCVGYQQGEPQVNVQPKVP